MITITESFQYYSIFVDFSVLLQLATAFFSVRDGVEAILNYCCMCSIKAKKYSTIYGGGETEVLVIKLQFVVAHLCAKVTQNKLRGKFFSC